MKNITGFVAAVLLLVVTGCSPKIIQPDKDVINALRNSSVIEFVRYDPAELVVVTPGKAIAGGGGLLGGLFSEAMFRSDGRRMTEDYSLVDPAIIVQSEFADSVIKKLGVISIDIIEEVHGSSELSDLKSIYDDTMIIDFETKRTMLFYAPTDWQHYRIAYTVKVRMIDLKNLKVIWKSTCAFVDKDKSSSLTLEELENDSGALLKEKISEAAKHCGVKLAEGFNLL